MKRYNQVTFESMANCYGIKTQDDSLADCIDNLEVQIGSNGVKILTVKN